MQSCDVDEWGGDFSSLAVELFLGLPSCKGRTRVLPKRLMAAADKDAVRWTSPPPGFRAAVSTVCMQSDAEAAVVPTSGQHAGSGKAKCHGDGGDGRAALVPVAAVAPRPQRVNGVLVLTLMLVQSLWTLLLTAVPVAVKGVGVTSAPYLTWYSSSDVMRLVEPIVTLPLSFWILWESGALWSHATCCQSGTYVAMVAIDQHVSGHGSEGAGAGTQQHGSQDRQQRDSQPPCRRPLIVALVFMLGGALYEQGAAFHSAAVMFKHPVEDLMLAGWKSLTPEEDNLLGDLYVWIRTTWEHAISHYLYAVGGVIISFTFQYAYRDWRVEGGLASARERALWVANWLVYVTSLSELPGNMGKGCVDGCLRRSHSVTAPPPRPRAPLLQVRWLDGGSGHRLSQRHHRHDPVHAAVGRRRRGRGAVAASGSVVPVGQDAGRVASAAAVLRVVLHRAGGGDNVGHQVQGLHGPGIVAPRCH